MTDCIMPEYRIGDDFSLTVALTDDADLPLVLDHDDLVAQVYNADGVELLALAVADGTEAGEYVLSVSTAAATVDFSEWPKQVVTNIFDTSDNTSSAEIHIRVVRQLSREVTP